MKFSTRFNLVAAVCLLLSAILFLLVFLRTYDGLSLTTALIMLVIAFYFGAKYYTTRAK